MNQWIFNPEMEAPKAIMDGTEVVMYIDDVPEQIIAKVVELHNQGKKPEEINAYLAEDNACFTDTREFIMEQINNYVALASGVAPAPLPTPATPAQAPAQTDTLSPQQRAANTRKANQAAGKTGDKSAGPAKRQSTGDAIKSLQEKIDLLKILDGAESLEIPTGLSKASRDILVEYQKEQEALTTKYIGLVQQM